MLAFKYLFRFSQIRKVLLRDFATKKKNKKTNNNRIAKSREMRNVDVLLADLTEEKKKELKVYLNALTGGNWSYYINNEAMAFANLDNLTGTVNVCVYCFVCVLSVCIVSVFSLYCVFFVFLVSLLGLWTLVNCTESWPRMDMFVPKKYDWKMCACSVSRII